MMRKLVNKIPFAAVLMAVMFQFAVAVDYYTLALQWPAGRCYVGDYACYTPIPKVFSLHGLWPSLNGPGKIENCAFKTAADMNNDLSNYPHYNSLTMMMPQLLYKPNVVSKWSPDLLFWQYQWNKHGSCAPLSVTDYFDEAMTLLQDTKIMARLSSRNIVPGSTYAAQDYQAALANHNPSIICKYDAAIGGFFLNEIRFCVDLSFKLMPCANPSFSSCGGPHGQVEFTSPPV